MLHIIRHSAFTSNALTLCLETLSNHDSILLMDDGCYNLRHKLIEKAALLLSSQNIYYIGIHAGARAQNNAELQPITLAQSLELIFNHDNTITWS